MTTAHAVRVRRAAVALAACLAVAACAHDGGYSGGAYTSFTFHATVAATAKPVVTAPPQQPRARPGDLDRWIADDEAALRRAAHLAPNAYGTHLASLLNGLWLAHRDRELAQRLASIGARFAGASNERADGPFFRGDDSAAFDAYAARDAELRTARTLAHQRRWLDAIARLRRVREGAPPDGRTIDAALLEGDAFAACGHYDAARTTWYRAFSTAILQPPARYRFFPEWTSAMRRLLHHRSSADRPSTAPACRALPRPIVDPVS